MDLNKIYKDEEGNDVILIGEIEIPRVSAGVAQKEGVGHKTQKPSKTLKILT